MGYTFFYKHIVPTGLKIDGVYIFLKTYRPYGTEDRWGTHFSIHIVYHRLFRSSIIVSETGFPLNSMSCRSIVAVP